MKVTTWAPEPMLLHKSASEEKNKPSALDFGQVLHSKLQEVNQLQLEANELTKEFLAGGNIELHDVMLAAEQSSLALQLTVQIRNKIVEAYQEIARMQI